MPGFGAESADGVSSNAGIQAVAGLVSDDTPNQSISNNLTSPRHETVAPVDGPTYTLAYTRDIDVGGVRENGTTALRNGLAGFLEHRRPGSPGSRMTWLWAKRISDP